MLTLFVALTLENLPDQIRTGRELSDWTLVYFISYAMVAAFLIFNILIGVVINSLEEARAIEHARERMDRYEHGEVAPTPEERIADGARGARRARGRPQAAPAAVGLDAVDGPPDLHDARAGDPRPARPPRPGQDDLPVRRCPRARRRHRLSPAHAARPRGRGQLVATGDIEVTQRGQVVDLATARGAIRPAA